MIAIAILTGLWGVVAAYHLARGLRSGDMLCFFSYLPGRTTRAEHPVRFWTYAAVNLFIMTVSALMLWAVWAGAMGRY